MKPTPKQIPPGLLTTAEAQSLASKLSSPLSLEEVLRDSYKALVSRLSVERLNMIPLRPNEFTVTLCVVEGGAEGPTIRSKIIELEESRLRRCAADQKENVVRFADASEHDRVEQQYLLNPNTRVAIYLPLLLQQSLKGVLVLCLGKEETIGASHTEYLQSVAGHLALAIENSDAYFLERRRGRQLHMISEIAKQAVRLENLDEFLNSSSSLVRDEFDYQAVEIWTLGSQSGRVDLRGCAHKAPRQQSLPAVPSPLVVACTRQEQVLCNNNALADPRWAPVFEGTSSQLAVPISLRGRVLGVLAIESSRLNAFPDEDTEIMETAASLIASAFDHLRLYEHAQQSNEYMQALLDSVKDLAILSTDVHGYVIKNSAGAQAVFRIPRQEILGQDVLTLFANPKYQHELARFMSAPDIPVLERNRIPQTIQGLERFLDMTVQRVYDPEKHTIGFLFIARDVTDTVLLHEKLEALTITDELTGLYNQRSFFSTLAAEIERARRVNSRLSLCLFDLDSFKKFNDAHGHLLGSQVLKETAQLLRNNVRSNIDSCYRYGGDEFIVIMSHTPASAAMVVAERVRVQLHEHFRGQISASLGIAEYSEGLDARKLMIKADQAMYAAKQKGGNRIVIAE